MAAKQAFELLSFDDFCRAFQRVIKYLETHRELMDAHMVDFFTSAHWETLLPRQIREDLELLQYEDLSALPTACNHESEIFDKFGENLKQFLTEATQAQLKSFSWVRDGREFSSECKVNFIPHIMTPKKSYEVEVMSDIINRLSTQFQVRKVRDHVFKCGVFLFILLFIYLQFFYRLMHLFVHIGYCFYLKCTCTCIYLFGVFLWQDVSTALFIYCPFCGSNSICLRNRDSMTVMYA